ncbi:MAG: sulfotransferase domain-containing protein [Lachnospiraceae bacterium]|nr:sulfotransferase domain-containing protein [Lachnospiraceae bacterium]
MEKLYSELQSVEQMEEFLYGKKIVIYGIGIYGQCLVDYLCSIGWREQIDSIVVTDINNSPKRDYAGFDVWNAQDRFINIGESWIVIAVSDFYRRDLCDLVRQHTLNYICISDRLHYWMRAKCNSNIVLPIGKVDFCVAGFAKCGTTSLFGALSKQENIFMPQCKETLFFEWYKSINEPEKFLKKKYFKGAEKKQVIGMIEPSFFCYAREVSQLLGRGIKIIFLLRNPVEALFSFFKMATRSGGDEELECLYQKSGFNDNMYTEYLQHKISMHALTMANYSFWIKQYLEYFPKEQIKIIFFEDLIKNPQWELNEILEYIGCIDIGESITLPHMNSGDFVMADKVGYMLAVQRKKLLMKQRSADRYTNEDNDELNRVKMEYQSANKIYHVKMTPEQRMLAKDFFNEDVKWLESMTNRNLTDLWNW